MFLEVLANKLLVFLNCIDSFFYVNVKLITPFILCVFYLCLCVVSTFQVVSSLITTAVYKCLIVLKIKIYFFTTLKTIVTHLMHKFFNFKIVRN